MRGWARQTAPKHDPAGSSCALSLVVLMSNLCVCHVLDLSLTNYNFFFVLFCQRFMPMEKQEKCWWKQGNPLLI